MTRRHFLATLLAALAWPWLHGGRRREASGPTTLSWKTTDGRVRTRVYEGKP